MVVFGYGDYNEVLVPESVFQLPSTTGGTCDTTGLESKKLLTSVNVMSGLLAGLAQHL